MDRSTDFEVVRKHVMARYKSGVYIRDVLQRYDISEYVLRYIFREKGLELRTIGKGRRIILAKSRYAPLKKLYPKYKQLKDYVLSKTEPISEDELVEKFNTTKRTIYQTFKTAKMKASLKDGYYYMEHTILPDIEEMENEL